MEIRFGSVQLFVQQVEEKYPDTRQILIHDNGTQFISNEFTKSTTRLQIHQVFTRRNHPQTIGKIVRMNKTEKDEAIRIKRLVSYQAAIDILQKHEYMYNNQRMHTEIIIYGLLMRFLTGLKM